MKRLRLAGLFLFYTGFVIACRPTTDDISPDPVITTASLSGDELNTITVDSINHFIILQIGPYSNRTPYRSTQNTLLLTASPQSFIVAQYDTSKLSKPLELTNEKATTTFARNIDLSAYSNQNPLRLRVIHNGATGTVVTVNSGGTAYTLQVKTDSALKLEGVIGEKGFWSDNADTVRLSSADLGYHNAIFMGISGLYNGTGPGRPTFSLINVRTKEKTRVFANGDLTTWYIDTQYLTNRPGTYQVSLETVDGRTALSPFFIKIT